MSSISIVPTGYTTVVRVGKQLITLRIILKYALYKNLTCSVDRVLKKRHENISFIKLIMYSCKTYFFDFFLVHLPYYNHFIILKTRHYLFILC